MLKNKSSLITTALISSFLFANVASALVEEDRGGNTPTVRQVSMMSDNEWTYEEEEINSSVNGNDLEDEFEEVEEGLATAKDIQDFMKSLATDQANYEKVGGEGTYYPGLKKAYYGQKAGKAAWELTKFGLYATVTLAAPTAVRGLGDFVIGHVGPVFVKTVGDTAEKLASAANSGWTYLDISGRADAAVRYFARKTAEGEALRDIGTIATMVQDYAVPAGVVLASAAKSVVTASWSSATSVYSWFTNKTTEADVTA